MFSKSLPNLRISSVFAFSAIKCREKSNLLWVSSIREVTIVLFVFHNSRSLPYNISAYKREEIPHRMFGKVLLFYDCEIRNAGFASAFDMSSLLALSNVIRTILESKKSQTVNLEEQCERSTKSEFPVDKT